MKRLLIIGLILLLWALLAGCGSDSSASTKRTQLNVFAAMSFKDSLTTLEKIYENENPGVDLVYNFAASGTLQNQAEQGAPCDIFISASQKQLKALEEKGLILAEGKANLVKNRLVVIVPAKGNTDINQMEDLLNPEIETIAIGAPEIVPAGQYTKESLSNLGLWTKIEPKFIPGKDARQVLTYVETGNVEAGIVYRSDALKSSKVKAVIDIPASSHSPIIYPAGVLKTSLNKDEAYKFLRFLQGEKARKVFFEAGFMPI